MPRTGSSILQILTLLAPLLHATGILADAHLAGPVYLYQACFDLPVSCLPESLQRVGVRLGRLKPDLLRLQRSSTDQPWTITIIDAKATNVMKPSHQAQVTFYAHFLPQCLSAAASGDAGGCMKRPLPLTTTLVPLTTNLVLDVPTELQRLLSSRLVWSGEGGVWLCKKESCGAMLSEWLEPFSLGPWLQLLQEDLLHRLPASAFACDVEDVAWQLTPSCQVRRRRRINHRAPSTPPPHCLLRLMLALLCLAGLPLPARLPPAREGPRQRAARPVPRGLTLPAADHRYCGLVGQRRLPVPALLPARLTGYPARHLPGHAPTSPRQRPHGGDAGRLAITIVIVCSCCRAAAPGDHAERRGPAQGPSVRALPLVAG